jgi:hypothetical protein
MRYTLRTPFPTTQRVSAKDPLLLHDIAETETAYRSADVETAGGAD